MYLVISLLVLRAWYGIWLYQFLIIAYLFTLCVASMGVGQNCIMFWGSLDQTSGVHGNRKPPLTYNLENGVSTFSRLLLIRSFLYLQVTRTFIKSRTSSSFGQIEPLTTELAALERLKTSNRLIMGKWCIHASSFIFDRINIKVASNQDRHKSSVEFAFGPNQTPHFEVTCPWVTKISHFWTWISLKSAGQSWSNLERSGCAYIRPSVHP